MEKEDIKSGGLLSKMVRFVRNPTVNWSDLDQLGQDSEESQYSKQALKAMLERKRQNDFVRKREFEHLRKLRQAQLAQSAKTPPLQLPVTASVSTPFLQTTHSGDADERADTLKKIDEIEAQMAQQWWRGKQAADAATMPMALPQGGNVLPESFKAPPSPESAPLLEDVVPGESLPLLADTGIPGKPSMRGDTDFTPAFAPTEIAPPVATSLVAPTFSQFEHDPELEEAAIVFANGDAEAAESSLKALIAQRSQNVPGQLPLWLALLDLYRAAGWQERFDDAAMDFVARFGRSAPAWFAMPQQAGQLSEIPEAAESARVDFRWHAPAILNELGLKTLLASKARSAGPWFMDWSALQAIEASVLQDFLQAVRHWSEEQGQLVFAGQEQLLSVVAESCPAGSSQVDQDWWHLRLALQRLMHLQDDFELTALDFCVTYERSPPSWVDPVNQFMQDGQSASSAAHAVESGPESVLPHVLWREHAPRFSLQGVIEGDALPWLNQAQEAANLGETVAIDCSRLVRMDFAAAGSVLNWAAEMQAQGHVLQFSQLHQLVAVFFNVVGVQEHAQVMPRKD